jgi:hypothetical protein
MACTEPSMKRINALTKQLDKIEKKQEKAEKANTIKLPRSPLCPSIRTTV